MSGGSSTLGSGTFGSSTFDSGTGDVCNVMPGPTGPRIIAHDPVNNVVIASFGIADWQNYQAWNHPLTQMHAIAQSPQYLQLQAQLIASQQFSEMQRMQVQGQQAEILRLQQQLQQEQQQQRQYNSLPSSSTTATMPTKQQRKQQVTAIQAEVDRVKAQCMTDILNKSSQIDSLQLQLSQVYAQRKQVELELDRCLVEVSELKQVCDTRTVEVQETELAIQKLQIEYNQLLSTHETTLQAQAAQQKEVVMSFERQQSLEKTVNQLRNDLKLTQQQQQQQQQQQPTQNPNQDEALATATREQNRLRCMNDELIMAYTVLKASHCSLEKEFEALRDSTTTPTASTTAQNVPTVVYQCDGDCKREAATGAQNLRDTVVKLNRQIEQASIRTKHERKKQQEQISILESMLETARSTNLQAKSDTVILNGGKSRKKTVAAQRAADQKMSQSQPSPQQLKLNNTSPTPPTTIFRSSGVSISDSPALELVKSGNVTYHNCSGADVKDRVRWHEATNLLNQILKDHLNICETFKQEERIFAGRLHDMQTKLTEARTLRWAANLNRTCATTQGASTSAAEIDVRMLQDKLSDAQVAVDQERLCRELSRARQHVQMFFFYRTVQLTLNFIRSDSDACQATDKTLLRRNMDRMSVLIAEFSAEDNSEENTVKRVDDDAATAAVAAAETSPISSTFASSLPDSSDNSSDMSNSSNEIKLINSNHPFTEEELVDVENVNQSEDTLEQDLAYAMALSMGGSPCHESLVAQTL